MKRERICFGVYSSVVVQTPKVTENTTRRMTDGQGRSPNTHPNIAMCFIFPILITSSLMTMTSAPSIVPLVVQLGSYFPPGECKILVLESAVKLFANPNRGKRIVPLDVTRVPSGCSNARPDTGGARGGDDLFGLLSMT
ncbi:hypothetical protein BJY52DRAFT_1290333 [Lactarius psammicola]|nr:hypothetical protein BJY52DRAFT_1290333 [Lactarius psammicola]